MSPAGSRLTVLEGPACTGHGIYETPAPALAALALPAPSAPVVNLALCPSEGRGVVVEEDEEDFRGERGKRAAHRRARAAIDEALASVASDDAAAAALLARPASPRPTWDVPARQYVAVVLEAHAGATAHERFST